MTVNKVLPESKRKMCELFGLTLLYLVSKLGWNFRGNSDAVSHENLILNFSEGENSLFYTNNRYELAHLFLSDILIKINIIRIISARRLKLEKEKNIAKFAVFPHARTY